MKFESGFVKREDSESSDSSLDDAEQITAEKIVDICTEKDLKYRDMGLASLFATLEFGVINDFNRGQFDDEKDLAEKINEKRTVTNTAEKQKDMGFVRYRNSGESYDPSEMVAFHDGNVFYPEGNLHVIQGMLHGNLPDNIYSRDEASMQMRVAHDSFLKAKEILDKRGVHIIDPKHNDLLEAALSKYEYGRATERSMSQADREMVVEEFDRNYEAFREEWLKLFHEEARRGYAGHRNAFVVFDMSIGTVFDGDTEVLIGGCDDYPTEAVITSANNRRNICGIFVNTKEKAHLDSHRGTLSRTNDDNFLKEAPNLHGEVTLEEYLKNTIINIDSISVLNGFLESVPQELHSKIRRAIELPESTQELSSEESDKQLETILENLGIKNGESVWETMISLGKRFKLPIYDLSGNVLWPNVQAEQ